MLFEGKAQAFASLTISPSPSNICGRTTQLQRVAVVDLDVHQGDGTASIFSGDDQVFTLSVHGRKNFPFRKQQSKLDIELEDGTRRRRISDKVEPSLEKFGCSSLNWSFINRESTV